MRTAPPPQPTPAATAATPPPPPRTILLVDVGHGPIRGADQVNLTLIDGIDPARYRFVLLTNHPAMAEACHTRGIPIEFHPVRMLFAPHAHPRDLLDLVRFARLTTRLIRTHNIALIHSSNGNSCAWLFPAALWCRVPLLAHIHNYWSRRMRLLIGAHLADRIVGVAHGVMRAFHNDPVAARRLSIIYNGLDDLTAPATDRPTARAEFALPDDHVVIALIGYLVALKCGDIAIAAMRALPPDVARRATLLMVGDGPQRAVWQTQAAGLPVLFTGQRDDVHHLLRNVIDLVILPSDSEAFSIVLLEAAAAGLPRIGTNIGGIPESINHAQDGLIVPVHDAPALARAIATLVRDPALARRYGDAALARLHARFSVAGFLANFTAVYDDLTASAPPPCRARVWTAIRSTWFQLTSRAYAGLEAQPPSGAASRPGQR
jgi:glycosyltransferase involved in cell wall biosynthesis